MSRRTITYERLLKRDKKYRNFRFFFTVILITAGVLFIRHVDTRLAEYESSLPDQTVKTFIQAIENNDYTSVNHDAITEEAFSSLCSLAKNGTITFRKIIQPNVNEHHYQLQQNGNQIILLKLQIRPAMKDEHYDRWNINSVEFSASAEQTAADVLTAFENRDFSLIYESVDPGLYACETQSEFESFLYSAVDGKTFSLSESDTSTDTEKVFVYLLDGERFFTAKMQNSLCACNFKRHCKVLCNILIVAFPLWIQVKIEFSKRLHTANFPLFAIGQTEQCQRNTTHI